MHENTSTQKILKYPHDATPIPGPHLGRSELYTTLRFRNNNNGLLSRVVFSLFLLLLLLPCIPPGIRIRLGEKKVSCSLTFRSFLLKGQTKKGAF